MKTSELIGTALDWAVAKCEEVTLSEHSDGLCSWLEHEVAGFWHEYSPSTSWEQGGPIIEREITKLFKNVGGTYTTQIRHEEDHSLVSHKVLAGWTNCAGPTPLIAAMRCYVVSKLGDEIEIPKELL